MFQPPNAVRLHFSLAKIAPKIWRRLAVPCDWTDTLLHGFCIGGLRYDDPALLGDGVGGPCVFDYAEVQLQDFVGHGGSFTYAYDFGDDWQHLIRIEDWLALDPAPCHALCFEGARARPPQDVGGSGVMRISSGSSATQSTKSTAPRSDGRAGISIRNGSIST
ncbi:pRiA4b ORF-3-like protein [Paracoccus pantotrophus]|nr:pRiA4b ORF-3-like protein [Paracoccus pantotrophus]